jgi:hypothetical protein
MNRKDIALLEEIYRDIKEESLLEESVLSTIIEIATDLKASLKRGLHKEDIVYYLRLIKSRSINFYNSLMKALKMRILNGFAGEKYDKTVETILMIIMNVVAFPLAVGTVLTIDKLMPMEKVIDYAKAHKHQVIKVIEDIDNAVMSIYTHDVDTKK